MKTRISELPTDLKKLAEKRANEYHKYLIKDLPSLPASYNGDYLAKAFNWHETPEKHEFWNLVNQRQYEKVITLKTSEQ